MIDGEVQYTCELKYDGASISLTYEMVICLRQLREEMGLREIMLQQI